MRLLRLLATASLAVACTTAAADAPATIAAQYAAQAGSGFSASPTRGQTLFTARHGVNAELASCTACHTATPASVGRHAITGKTIAPMATAANPERLTDPAKVEKWFRRNCREVIGRECSAGEKADVMAWLIKGA